MFLALFSLFVCANSHRTASFHADDGSTLGLDGKCDAPLLVELERFLLRHLAVGTIGEENCLLSGETAKHARFEGKGLGLLLSIHRNEIPAVSMAAGHDDILAWIAVNEARLVPRGGNLLHEVNLELRLLGEVARCEGKVLTAGLEGNGGCQFKDIGGATRVASAGFPVESFLEHGTAIFHRGCGIADEGMQAGVTGFHLAETLTEVEVLAGEDSLGTAIHRSCTFHV